MKHNLTIRDEASRSGVRLWQVAERMGLTEFTLSRKLRHELSDEDQARVLEIIRDLAKEKEE